jgi:2-polyprenyl-6-methoxyphenol hydroxylase-like FAD-dependent oxidoreductase
MPDSLPSSRTGVVIVGGGIGGLALALALAARRVPTVVIEQHPRLRPSAAAVVLQPNGLHALDALDVLTPVLARGAALEHVRFLTTEGTPLLELEYASLPAPHHHAATVLPSELQEVLLARLGRHPDAEVRWGTVFAGLVGEGGSVQGVRLQDGRAQSVLHADLVVGADGTHSAVRAGMGVPTNTLQYPEVHFQMVGGPVAGLGPEWRQYLGSGWTLGIGPLSAEQTAIVFALHQRDAGRLRRLGFEDFRTAVARSVPDLAPAFAPLTSWQEVVVTVPERVDADPWVVPGAVLMGDAAHALSPHLRQGANLALVGAVTLAEVVADAREAQDFSSRRLGAYEHARRPQTALLQGESERTARTVLARNPPARWLRRRSLHALARDPARRLTLLRVMAGLAETASAGDRLRSLVRP